MTLIYAYKSLGIIRDITIQRADGTTIVPGSNDKVRATIGRKGESAKLIVTSGADTANGSSFTKGDANRLRLDAADLATVNAGVYTLFVDYFDNANDGEWTKVQNQVIYIED